MAVLLGVGLAFSSGLGFFFLGWVLAFPPRDWVDPFFLGLGGWPFLLGSNFLGWPLPSRSWGSPFLLGVVVGTSFMEWSWSFLHWFGLASLGWPFQGMALPSRSGSWPFLFGVCQLAPSSFGTGAGPSYSGLKLLPSGGCGWPFLLGPGVCLSSQKNGGWHSFSGWVLALPSRGWVGPFVFGSWVGPSTSWWCLAFPYSWR